MKNIIILVLTLCFFAQQVEAQSLMDRVSKSKKESQNTAPANSTRANANVGNTASSVTSNNGNETFVNIQNRWKGTFLHKEYGPVEVSSLRKNSWHSAQWAVVQGKDGYKMLKNRIDNSYLVSKDGKLETSVSVGPGSQSAHWKIIPVAGTRCYKLQNRLSNTFLHNENGKIELGPIQDGWHSAQWRNQFAKADVAVSYEGPRAMMYFRYTDQVQGGGGLDLKVGSEIIVLPNQTVRNAHGISFNPNKPRICGMKFTVAEISPYIKFTEPFPENMRDTNNNSFAFEVVQVK